jgi:E3 ubiquitin-protein ligase HUWE1
MPPSAEPTGAVALPLAAAGSSGQQPSEYQTLLGNIEIPEGVDPSFLAALPEDMRQEVIAEQLRLQRLRQRARAQTTDTTTQVYNTLNQLIFKNLCNSIYSFHSRPFWK